MAELRGMLATAILKVVSDQIGSAVGGQITLQKNFDADLKKMKMALESVEAVLKAAERQSITDEPTRLWLKRLTDAMYDISSVIDEFEEDTQTQSISRPSARKLSLKKHLLRFVSYLPVGPRITMPNQMKMMRGELKEITDNHQSFTLTEGTSAVQLSVNDIRETSSSMQDKEHIVGRTDETEKILARLSESMTKDFTILSIYGVGGLGKTTLANIVFNNSQFRGYSQVWIYVSQAFDLRKIGNSIISQLAKAKSQYTDMQMIHNSLRELLSDKILIVLDDLWEENKSHLDDLIGMLKVGESGRIVAIVTTRSEDIAIKISTIRPHKLATLTDKMCWTIIKQKSDFELREDQKELEHIGHDIASKCGGVALAAQSLGHMLHSLKSDEWESIRNIDIWNLSDSKDSSLMYVLTSLKLCYSVMPSNLKLCFAYCAIFPKGYKIIKNDLIQQWISLGFIEATNMPSTWQGGEKYIRQLLGLSFLEHSKSASTRGLNFENDTWFTMHDLVHDLARSVMVDEIFVSSKQGNGRGSFFHFALLDDCGKPLESSKMRALRFMECAETELHGAAFSSSRSMRVLDLSECSIHKLPDSIGVLKQLRYLNAPRVQDAIIPNSITRLSKLIYLNLHGSSRILALPESIGEIGSMEYLDLSGCSGIEKLPESFQRLKKLVHLDLSNCSHVGGVSMLLGDLTQLQYLNLSYCQNIEVLPEALGVLSKLQFLNLSFSSYVECCEEAEFLGALTKLEYLNLSSQHCVVRKLPEALGRFTQLKYLNLSGCSDLTKLPRLLGNCKNLVHLDLSDCYMVHCLDEALVGLTSLLYLNLKGTFLKWLPGDLTKLSYLNISDLRGSLENTFHSLINHISSNFCDLEHLDLSDNLCIESIPESLCSLRKLQTLDLSKCILLKKIPKSVTTMDSLKFLYLNGCARIEELPLLGSGSVPLPRFVVKPGKGESSSNLVLLQHTDPVELQISELENVKSAGEARLIKLMEKQSLQVLKLKWTRDVKRFVDDKTLLEKLVPPCTLKKLEIYGYNSVSFPSWLVSQVPNLESLVLRGMANLEEWYTSCSNGEVYMFEELQIHDCPRLGMKGLPPRAKLLEISNSDNVLFSWGESHTNASSSTSPVTTGLSIKHYKVPLHQWMFLQHLSGLSYLSISFCGDLTGSPETSQHLSSVEILCLEFGDLEELPKWTGELPSLQDLKISGFRELKRLRENMRKCTTLQALKLHFCGLESLPNWLGELTSLKELSMKGCGNLRSLPESIQQLTSLQKLEIGFCSELKHVVGSDEGKMNVTRNQKTVCALPTSLVDLKISGCAGIRSLPEGIQHLTNLQKLVISSCPDLRQWCVLEKNQMKLVHIKQKQIR